jgi:hypothetical protein
MEKVLADPQGAGRFPSQYASGVISGWKDTFEGAWDLKDRTRSLQLTLINNSGRRIFIEDVYFDSGTWFKSWPPVIEKGRLEVATVANKQGSWFTGVTGGVRMRI